MNTYELAVCEDSKSFLKKGNMKETIKRVFEQLCWHIAGLFICAIISLLVSCTTKKVVEEVPVVVPQVSLETSIETTTQDVQLVIEDHFTVTINEHGDTLRTDRQRNTNKIQQGTKESAITKRDSIPHPVVYTRTEYQPYIPKWCWWAIGAPSALLAVIIVVWLVKKKAHQH